MSARTSQSVGVQSVGGAIHHADEVGSTSETPPRAVVPDHVSGVELVSEGGGVPVGSVVVTTGCGPIGSESTKPNRANFKPVNAEPLVVPPPISTWYRPGFRYTFRLAASPASTNRESTAWPLVSTIVNRA